MHTYKSVIERDGRKFVFNFHFNSDMSGDVLITEPPEQAVLPMHNLQAVHVPGEALLEFFSYVAANAVTSWAEDLDFTQIIREHA